MLEIFGGVRHNPNNSQSDYVGDADHGLDPPFMDLDYRRCGKDCLYSVAKKKHEDTQWRFELPESFLAKYRL